MLENALQCKLFACALNCFPNYGWLNYVQKQCFSQGLWEVVGVHGVRAKHMTVTPETEFHIQSSICGLGNKSTLETLSFRLNVK